MQQAYSPAISNAPHNQEKGGSSLTARHPPGNQCVANTATELETDRADLPPVKFAGEARGESLPQTRPEQETNSSATNAGFEDDRGNNSLETNSSATGADSSSGKFAGVARGEFLPQTHPEQDVNSSASNAGHGDGKGNNPLENGSSATGAGSPAGK